MYENIRVPPGMLCSMYTAFESLSIRLQITKTLMVCAFVFRLQQSPISLRSLRAAQLFNTK